MARSTGETSKLAIDVILAEYTVSRTVMDRNMSSALGLIGLNVTAVAAVSGFVLSNHADVRLLLILPILSSALGLAFVGQMNYIRIVSEYIESELRPLVVEYTGDERLLGYGQSHQRHKGSGYLIQALAMGLVFPGVALAALFITETKLHGRADWTGWLFGAALTMTVVAGGLGRVTVVSSQWLRRSGSWLRNMRSAASATSVDHRSSAAVITQRNSGTVQTEPANEPPHSNT